MGEPILEIRDLAAGYGKSEVLHGVSMEIAAGEIITMVGANGAGKSTFLRSVFGLTDIRKGSIRFRGRDITGLRPHHLATLGLAPMIVEDVFEPIQRRGPRAAR